MQERRLRSGDVMEIPRGAVHVHPHRVAGPPIAVQKALAAALAPVANRRGYRASVD